MPNCPGCNKPVYFAERISSLGKDWHRPCLRCTNEECKKTLTAGSHSEHEGKPYCNRCYSASFGPKGSLDVTCQQITSNEPTCFKIDQHLQMFNSGFGHGGTESHVFLNSTGRT